MTNHPNIPIHTDTTIERAMRKAKEEQAARKSQDEPDVDKMKRAPVVKK